jgi:aldose 1-epimerase
VHGNPRLKHQPKRDIALAQLFAKSALSKRLFWLCLCLFGWAILPKTVLAASTDVTSFGTTSKGQAVSRVTLTNDANMRVSILTYGATLTAIDVPDATGRIQNVVLSLPDMASYERTQRRWGGIIGRYAGRIGGARFALDRQTHTLEPGRNGVTLHGGSNGYDKRVWAYRTRSNSNSVSAVFTLDSPAGDQGFPGALVLEVTYRLTRATNDLKIEYRARTTAPTVVNFTNHVFLNLAGASNGTIYDHDLMILARRYAPTDTSKIPTGQLLSVTGTPLDFQKPTPIGAFITANNALLTPSGGFDHSYAAADKPHRIAKTIAIVRDPASGRRLTIDTTEPGLQFNSGNGFDGTEVGSEGVAYSTHAGFALETQHLPDSPNQQSFPSTRLDPHQRFYSVTRYRFGID